MEQIMLMIMVLGVCFFVKESISVPSPEEGVSRRSASTSPVELNRNEADALAFLRQFNEMAQENYYKVQLANWNFKTNITDENQRKTVEAKLENSEFLQDARRNASAFDRSGFTPDTVRQLEKLLYIGDAALENKEDLEKLKSTVTMMQSRYSKAEVCAGDECLSLEPDLYRIFSESHNYAELSWAWHGWRDAAGKTAKEDFKEYVKLKNKAAVANDEPDAGAYWRSWYEVDDLKADVSKLYEELKPFYQQLHAYVRRKLYNVYGSKYINVRGPIPAHLLGNMWAQQWLNIYDICEPFPGKQSADITTALKEKGYDEVKMFEAADDFFASLGLDPVPEAFWNHSMLVKPEDGRSVTCHASAFDFYNGKDFRIKQCTEVTQTDYRTIHHEMGHIQYYLQYKHLPVVYRRGANPGFHEAVGDCIALSSSTPKHMHTVGLLEELVDNPEADINYLLRTALSKIAFLPFGILMDIWRWGVFDGSIPETKFNEQWWKLRLEYQGLVPPTKRSETDFDPAAKYHIVADVPYVRYFIARIFQFQFHEAMCNASGHTGPLHKCDIYQSREAGTLLGNMLKLGSSVPWPDALESITRQRQMSALSLVKYFQPLMDFMVRENEKNGEVIGWPDTDWMPDAPPAWKSGTTRTTMPAFTLIFMFVIYRILTEFGI